MCDLVHWAKTEKDRVKKRAKKHEKWRGKNRRQGIALSENGRTARESACFVRPGALAKTEKDRVKKRAKNAKNGGVKIDARV